VAPASVDSAVSKWVMAERMRMADEE